MSARGAGHRDRSRDQGVKRGGLDLSDLEYRLT
jgi:hypothetical protein